MFINNLYVDEAFLEEEDIIAKLHLLIELEKSDPYANREIALQPLEERIQSALAYVPECLRKYVLALFANVIYFPNSFSQAILYHLLDRFLNKTGIKRENLGKECLILEQDPTGIVNDFLRQNAIAGRLDKNLFQRTQQVEPFVLTAQDVIKKGIDDLTKVIPFLDRKYWIILVDNSLSGKSLHTDLKRLTDLADTMGKKPTFVLLIRTLAYPAKKMIFDEFGPRLDERLVLEYGVFLDESFTISEDNERECALFHSPDTTRGVIMACKWLVNHEEYKNDPKLKKHKKDSGDDEMLFGFRGCGLTFVSSENCPSDSLPLLWYRNPQIYMAPFPRILSRIDDEEKHEEK